MKMTGPALLSVALAIAAATSEKALADPGDWEFVARPTVLAGDAPPANDIIGYGIALRYYHDDLWAVGLGLNQYSFDYETPNRWLNIPSPADLKAVDATNDSTVISAWLERRYGDQGAGWSWFWNAGFGYAFLSTEDVMGPRADGGTYDITTDVSDEFQLHTGIGVRRRFGENWVIEGAALLQYHFTDYKLTDRVSGATGSVGSTSVIGAHIGIGYRF